MSGNLSPSRGPMVAKSLGGSGIGILPFQSDRPIAHADRRIPRDVDGPLHALVRRAADRVKLERPRGGLLGVSRDGQVVVDVDGLDADGLADADDPPLDGGLVRLAV